MPPVRTAPAVRKIPQRTERSHEENQERAYIAASRRSDRSLEARVESARRASEIHKKRTGRALRVREEDVINEEMYEEEDDELSQQMRRMNALHPGFTSFSDRLNSYMAGHLGIRSALQQAIIQANQYNAQQLMNSSAQPGGSPPSANPSYHSVPQSPWAFTPLPNNQLNSHNPSPTFATSPDATNQHSAQVSMQERRPSHPGSMPPSHELQSPTLSHSASSHSSHPSTPHDSVLLPTSMSLVDTVNSPPPNQATTQYGMKPTTDPRNGSARPAYSQSPNSQIAPLTTQLPVETQQLFHGSQQTFNSNFYPAHIASTKSRTDSVNPDKKPHVGGLNQTLSMANMDYKYTNVIPDTLSTFTPPYDTDPCVDQDPFHDLGLVRDLDFGWNYDPIDMGHGTDLPSHNHACVTPGIGGEPAWNPDDFFNFGQAE